MKKIRCPKCNESIVFDSTIYKEERTLVFECSSCRGQFKIRIKRKQEKEEEVEEKVLAKLLVVENGFHYAQEIPLSFGKNILGRQVRGTSINCPILTTDPSVDTTHCCVEVKKNKQGKITFSLSDAQSNTGTFLMTEILAPNEQRYLHNEDIITIGATTLIFQINENEK